MKATVTKSFEGATEGGMKNVGDIIDVDEKRLAELEAAGVVKRGDRASASDDDDSKPTAGAYREGQADRQTSTASFPNAPQRSTGGTERK